MDMLNQALDSGEDKGDSGSENHIELVGEGGADAMSGVGPGTLTIDANGQYRLTTDTGQVTYRVVQVAQSDEGPTHMLNQVSSIPTPSQVIPSFNVASAEPVETLGDTKLTYIPTVSGGGDSVAQQATLDASGQYFVMMSPQDVLQASTGSQRVIAPRNGMLSGARGGAGAGGEMTRTTRDDRRRQSHNDGQYFVVMSPKDVLQAVGGQGSSVMGTKTRRDDRLRLSHNEVERRRRDKINNWIVQLSKLIPNCESDITKAGQISKGGILSKACDHINELRTANAQMADTLKDAERFSVDNELLRQQVEELKQENALLRQQLSQHGVLMPDLASQ